MPGPLLAAQSGDSKASTVRNFTQEQRAAIMKRPGA